MRALPLPATLFVMAFSIPNRSLAGWLWLCSVGLAWAQIGKTHPTLESKAGQAVAIYRGHITGVKREVLVAKNQPLPDGTSYSDGVVVYRFQLRIAETLKGRPAATIALSKKTSAYDRRIDAWAKARTEFLWFVGPPRKPLSKPIHAQPPGPSWNFLRFGPAVAPERSYSKPHALPIFSMDLQILRTPKAVLARARAFAKAHPKALPLTRMRLPRSLAHHCKGAGDANRIILPVVPELEAIARRMIAKPHSFAPKGQPPGPFLAWLLREGGVNCLSHFRNDANITLLRTLLADPIVVGQTGANDSRSRLYPVRKAAFDQLTQWGVKVERPVITIPE